MSRGNFDARGVPADKRLLGKPTSNINNSLPVMVYDFLDPKLKLTAQNIWQAQMVGWCRILTYDCVAEQGPSGKSRSAKRYESLIKAGVVYKPEFGWRDEYPFASTVENNGSVFVGHAPASEQRNQGKMIAEFYRKHKAVGFFAENGRSFFFEVRVINHPSGMITRPDTAWR